MITILAANLDNTFKALEFRIELPPGFSSVAELVFEQRTVPITAGMLSDFIEPHGTKAFRIYSLSFLVRMRPCLFFTPRN